MSACFVTATGTDIGKTFVTAGLIRHLRAAGETVSAFKPVVSGFTMEAAAASDPGMLLAALGEPINEETVGRVSPWRYEAALSPDMAAAREGTALPYDDILAACRRAVAETDGTLFIEGVGGVMVPLDDRHTVLDWMADLAPAHDPRRRNLSGHDQPHADGAGRDGGARARARRHRAQRYRRQPRAAGGDGRRHCPLRAGHPHRRDPARCRPIAILQRWRVCWHRVKRMTPRGCTRRANCVGLKRTVSDAPARQTRE